MCCIVLYCAVLVWRGVAWSACRAPPSAQALVAFAVLPKYQQMIVDHGVIQHLVAGVGRCHEPQTMLPLSTLESCAALVHATLAGTGAAYALPPEPAAPEPTWYESVSAAWRFWRLQSGVGLPEALEESEGGGGGDAESGEESSNTDTASDGGDGWDQDTDDGSESQPSDDSVAVEEPLWHTLQALRRGPGSDAEPARGARAAAPVRGEDHEAGRRRVLARRSAALRRGGHGRRPGAGAAGVRPAGRVFGSPLPVTREEREESSATEGDVEAERGGGWGKGKGRGKGGGDGDSEDEGLPPSANEAESEAEEVEDSAGSDGADGSECNDEDEDEDEDADADASDEADVGTNVSEGEGDSEGDGEGDGESAQVGTAVRKGKGMDEGKGAAPGGVQSATGPPEPEAVKMVVTLDADAQLGAAPSFTPEPIHKGHPPHVTVAKFIDGTTAELQRTAHCIETILCARRARRLFLRCGGYP